jgi:lipopolysaccharide export system protein LptC
MTTDAAIIPGGGRRAKAAQAPAALGMRRDEQAFRRADRHSRRVRLLKIALPSLAVLTAAGFAAYSYFAIPPIEGVSVQGAAISDGKLVMANPKLDGFTKDNLPYSMTATRATQDLKQTGVIMLEQIDAKLPIDAEISALVAAASGTYDNSTNRLDIDSAITIKTTDGMEAKLGSAKIDIGSGTMTTSDPVEIERQGSRIEAESMSVSESGKLVVFERRVKVRIMPESAGVAAGGSDATD